jgi:outer membrane protein OmpU
MKNILLATTAMVMSAGMASAEVTFSGTSEAGISNGINGVTSYSHMGLKATGTTTTDSGLTFTVTQTLDAGREWSSSNSVDTESTATTLDTGWGTNKDNNTNFGSVSVSGDFGTLTFDAGGIEDLATNSEANIGDVSYSGTFGDVSLGMVFDADNSNAGASWSASVGYALGDLAIAAATNEDNYSVFSAAYAVGDFSISAEAADSDNTVTLGYTMGTVTAEASALLGSGDFDVSLGYTSGDMTVAYATDEDQAWEATGSYDLGGATLVAGVNESQYNYLGVAFSF